MSASLSVTQTATILQKSSTMSKHDEKPVVQLHRSSSIERILLICCPPYYTLTTILTWLKSSKNSLNLSAEKTIFFFRSLIFGSIILKYVSQFTKPIHVEIAEVKDNFKSQLESVISNIFVILSNCFKSTLLIKVSFCCVFLVLFVQMMSCVFFLCQAAFPVGLAFLIVSLIGIARLGYSLNRFSYNKRDTKRKRNIKQK